MFVKSPLMVGVNNSTLEELLANRRVHPHCDMQAFIRNHVVTHATAGRANNLNMRIN